MSAQQTAAFGDTAAFLFDQILDSRTFLQCRGKCTRFVPMACLFMLGIIEQPGSYMNAIIAAGTTWTPVAPAGRFAEWVGLNRTILAILPFNG